MVLPVSDHVTSHTLTDPLETTASVISFDQ